MKIEEIEIKNFRSINRQKIKCDYINVFCGANNTGKSNILHALNLFFDPYQKTTIDDLNKNIKSSEIRIRVKIDITNYPKKFLISIQDFSHKINGRKYIDLERRHRPEYWSKYYDVINKRKIPNNNLRGLNSFLKHNFTFFDINGEENLDFNKLENIFGNKFIREFSEHMIKKAESTILPSYKTFDNYLNRQLKDVLIDFQNIFNIDKKSVYFTSKPTNKELLDTTRLVLKQTDSGDFLHCKGQGVKNFALFILNGFLSNNKKSPRIIAIEEPDNHLHPSMVRFMIDHIKKIAQSNNKQFFITTHSPHLIDAVKPNSIFRVVMNSKRTEIIHPKLSEKNIADYYNHIYDGATESLLSEKVIITEGESDYKFLTLISEKIKIKNNKRDVDASFSKNKIQTLRVDGGSFHGPIPLLDQFKIKWIILGDQDKWKTGDFLSSIEKLDYNKKHPRIYSKLKKLHKENTKTNKEIRQLLYKYFNIICLPKEIEDLVVFEENAKEILKILKKYLPNRVKSVQTNKNLNNLEICRKVLNKKKPIWAVVLGREMSEDIISPSLKKLIKIILLSPPKNTL